MPGKNGLLNAVAFGHGVLGRFLRFAAGRLASVIISLIFNNSVFQITFKGRLPTRRFMGSIDASPPHLLTFTQVVSFLGFLT